MSTEATLRAHLLEQQRDRWKAQAEALDLIREGQQSMHAKLCADIQRIAGWIERDRREPDKVLCHLSSLRRALIDDSIALERKDGNDG